MKIRLPEWLLAQSAEIIRAPENLLTPYARSTVNGYRRALITFPPARLAARLAAISRISRPISVRLMTHWAQTPMKLLKAQYSDRPEP